MNKQEYNPNFVTKIFDENGHSFYQREHNKKIYWVYYPDGRIGNLDISFDKVHILSLWEDYPSNFTKEQIKAVKEEEPYWADFFKGRE